MNQARDNLSGIASPFYEDVQRAMCQRDVSDFFHKAEKESIKLIDDHFKKFKGRAATKDEISWMMNMASYILEKETHDERVHTDQRTALQ